MSGAILPPHTPSWRGAYLKHRDDFTFFYLFSLLLLYFYLTHERYYNVPDPDLDELYSFLISWIFIMAYFRVKLKRVGSEAFNCFTLL